MEVPLCGRLFIILYVNTSAPKASGPSQDRWSILHSIGFSSDNIDGHPEGYLQEVLNIIWTVNM